jgi:hypothetical protein
MSLHALRLALRTALGLALAVCLFSGAVYQGAEGGKATYLPDSEYPKMVKRNVKGIQDALKTSEDAMIEKARTAAVMIAAFAQQNLDGADAQQRATVRDAALKVADLIKAKKYADASKLAGTLPTLAADAKAKKEKVNLMEKYLTYSDLMHQFRHRPDGGWGVFGRLQRIQNKMFTTLPREEFSDDFVQEAYQIAVTADLLNSMPHKVRGKEWLQYTDDLRKASAELGEALKARDAKAAPVVISRMGTTCFACHKMLKVKNTGN